MEDRTPFQMYTVYSWFSQKKSREQEAMVRDRNANSFCHCQDQPAIDTCRVLDITDGTTELAHLQDQVQTKGQAATPIPLSMASLESVPLVERSKALHIARIAFPTLFPTGAASLNSLRERAVAMADYYCHLMRFRDDRFARHPKFRFWALNTQMRQQAFSASKCCGARTKVRAKWSA